jgi:ribokinase
VSIIGGVGDDANGSLLRRTAEEAGVDTTRLVTIADTPTGTALIAVDDAGENTIIVSPGANGRLTSAVLGEVAITADTILGLALEVPMETVVEAARQARAAGATVLLNPSPWRPVPPQLLASTSVLLVNNGEARAVLGTEPTDHASVLAALIGLGVPAAVVTLGADGAIVFDGEATAIAPVRVDAVDTTGAGDAFMGALASRLADGDDLVTAARFAVRVGAFAATKLGAQSSYPTLAELEASGL